MASPEPSSVEARLQPEAALARMRRLAVVFVGLAAAAGLLRGVGFAAAVAAGGALALANYHFLIWTVERILARGAEDATAVTAIRAAVGFVFRYVLLGLFLCVIFFVWRADALAVILGFSAPVLAVLTEGAVQVYWTLRSSGSPKSGDRF